MEKVENKKLVLEEFISLQAEGFECDKEAMINVYNLKKEGDSSIAIKVLSIFGGLLASLSFIGFLLMAGLYDSKIGMVVFGVACITFSIFFEKISKSVATDAIGVSSYILGYVLLGFGLVNLDINDNLVALLIGSFALGTLFLNRNYIIAFVAILIVYGSLFAIININNIKALFHLYIWVVMSSFVFIILGEASLLTVNKFFSKLYNPIRVGSLFSLVIALGVIGNKHLFPVVHEYIWISSIVMYPLGLYLVRSILMINKVEDKKTKNLVYFLLGLILLSTIYCPTVSGGLMVILASYLVAYKTGLAVGIISTIYFISQYYYDLNLTLLTKSMVLLFSGVMFLLCFLLYSKKIKIYEKV